ncbi:MAG: hypothetical protein R3F11_24640 [Verrucomicrobiales bacterium]
MQDDEDAERGLVPITAIALVLGLAALVIAGISTDRVLRQENGEPSFAVPNDPQTFPWTKKSAEGNRTMSVTAFENNQLPPVPVRK